jgi:MIP family channel proteins
MPDANGTHEYTAEPAVHISRAATAELLGTFILVLAGTAVAVAASLARPIAGQPEDSLAIGLAFGLALVALVAALGHVSGAHLNPAVTLGLASAGKFPWRFALWYIVAQFVGAILAALVVWGTFGALARTTAFLGATYPAPTATDGQAFLMELVITFILVLTITAVATDRRVPAPVAAVAIGFALAVAVLVGGPVSGGAANPARAIGPMIVAGNLTGWWIYLIAPIIGGILAALLYGGFLARTSAPKK